MWRQRQVLVAVAWALCAAVCVVADIRAAGPYGLEFEMFSPCDDKGSISIDFDVKLHATCDGVVYEGNLTFPYDMDDENLLTEFVLYEWDNNRGWAALYHQDFKDIMQYMMSKFPKLFEITFGAIGVKGKPMKAGTYELLNFFPDAKEGIENIPQFTYGVYKMEVTQSKDSTELGCLAYHFKTYERPVPSSWWREHSG